MKRLYVHLFALLFCATIFGCTEKQDRTTDTVIVESVLTNSSVQEVKLMNFQADDNSYTPVTAAEVYILQVTGNKIINTYEFQMTGDGIWSGSLRPMPGKEYQLLVKTPQGKEITATTVYPDTLKVYPYNSQSKLNGFPDLKYGSSAETCTCWIYGADYNPDNGTYSPIGKIDNIPPRGDFLDDGITYEDIKKEWYIYNNAPSQYARGKLLAFEKNSHAAPLVIAHSEPWDYIYFSNSGTFQNSRMIGIDGRRYSSSLPEHEQAYTLHPKSFLIIDIVNEDYDNFLLEGCAAFTGTERLSLNNISYPWTYLSIYSNIHNGKGIFGAMHKTKVTISDEQDVSDMDVWTKYHIEIPE